MVTVMIVDDDRSTTKLLQMLLEMDGFRVVISPRGANVLEKAHIENPDLFMIDYHLSDMNGVEVTKLIRADAKFGKSPIIVASGMNVEREARDAGANMFIVKPFEPSELAGIFNGLLG